VARQVKQPLKIVFENLEKALLSSDAPLLDDNTNAAYLTN
jgi:hypothetical protein